LLRGMERRNAQPGLRAGVFFGAVAIYLVLGLATKLGWTMAPTELGEESNPIGVGATMVAFGLTAFCVWWLFTRPGFARWLVGVESHGWFHATSYKGNQGVRVRRGTIIALLTVGVCGIITLVAHRSLGSPRSESMHHLQRLLAKWSADRPGQDEGLQSGGKGLPHHGGGLSE